MRPSRPAVPVAGRARRASLVLAAAPLALLLAACGGGADGGPAAAPAPASQAVSPGPAAPGPHGPADVRFATEMVPHHRQAVEMADLALSREVDPGLATLARRIRDAQAPEIAAMSGWLAGWGAPVPGDHGSSGTAGMHGGESDAPMADGMSTQGMSMQGMMSGGEMAALGDAAGTQFARLWLSGMVRHHRGAVEMAATELAAGTNPEAQALARSITTSQSQEIDAMTTMLARLPA